MAANEVDTLGTATARIGVATTLAVAVPVLVVQVTGDVHSLVRYPGPWWAAYLLFVGLLVANVEEWPVQFTATADRVVLAVLVVTGLAVFAMSSSYGFSIVLPVVAACAAGFIVAFRTALVVVAGQAVVIGVISLGMPGLDTGEAVLQAVAWAGFMVFAVLTVEAGERERRSRTRLAEANVALAATNERLAEANRELEAAQQLLADSSRNDERLRISRELHDLIGHQLTALSLQLEAATHRVTGSATDNVARSRQIASDLLDDVRAVVGQLRDGPNDGGVEGVGGPALPAADAPLSLLRRAAASVAPLQVDLDVDVGLADDERAMTVVRIVQEVLTNTVRHARAERVWIRIAAGEDGLVVDTRDDGVGARRIVAGHGLQGMRERVESAGGSLRVWSPDDGGFRLQAVVPPSGGVA